MKVKDAEILFIPGLDNSGPSHRQTRWQGKLGGSKRIEQRDWSLPKRDQWVEQTIEALKASQKPVILVAHSLGVATALHALQKYDTKVAGAFFVAPPDLANPALRPKTLAGFGPYPREPLPFPSVTVASRNDPLGSFEHAGDIANAWGSLLVDAGNSGHINTASGHGPWPEGTMVFAQFLSRI